MLKLGTGVAPAIQAGKWSLAACTVSRLQPSSGRLQQASDDCMQGTDYFVLTLVWDKQHDTTAHSDY